MKVKKLETFYNKSGLKGCKLSNVIGTGTGNLLCHPLLGLGEFPFPIIGPRGNKNWPPSMKVTKVGKFPEQKGFKGMQMVQFECPKH